MANYQSTYTGAYIDGVISQKRSAGYFPTYSGTSAVGSDSHGIYINSSGVIEASTKSLITQNTTGSVGNAYTPIYIDSNGQPVVCDIYYTSTNTKPSTPYLAVIKSDGVMEVGQYLDFHNEAETASDYTYRINNSAVNELTFSGSIKCQNNLQVYGAGYYYNSSMLLGDTANTTNKYTCPLQFYDKNNVRMASIELAQWIDPQIHSLNLYVATRDGSAVHGLQIRRTINDTVEARLTGTLYTTEHINEFKIQVGGSVDVNTVTTVYRCLNGMYILSQAFTNAPTTNHGMLIDVENVGTPFQMFFPDNQLYVYKRYKSGGSSGTWTGWSYMTATAISSSRKIKENIKPMLLEEAKKILDLEIVSFDYKESFSGEKNQFGLIAEDVEKIVPFMVCRPKDENLAADVNLGVDYTKAIPYLIKIIQEQQKDINNLKNIIKKMGVEI